MSHIEPTHAAMGAWIQRTPPDQPIEMLNLLRFRETADYSGHPELAPDTPISGRAAYQRYEAHTLPFLLEAGGSVTFIGDGGPPVIGPPDEVWHRVLIVRHKSVQAFLAFAQNHAYLAGLGHRTAALADSRLVPLTRPS